MWDSLQQWVMYYSVRSDLMNARRPHIISLDQRMYLHTLLFVRTMACNLPLVSFPSHTEDGTAELGRSPTLDNLQLRSKHTNQAQ